MTRTGSTIGIIGGSGMLGSAITTALLDSGTVQPADFWMSNTRGIAPVEEQHEGIHVTKNNQELTDACDVIILCVPPARFMDLAVNAPGKLIISVMAGVTLTQLKTQTGADRVVRAMSSPAASMRLAYSAWLASEGVSDKDRAVISAIFAACGKADEIFDEPQIDHFTAMTGPVPGFVAYFAQCMVDHATQQGIAPDVADRAIRQLFFASGHILQEGKASPATHVQDMIDYDGTTAAGLNAMLASPLSKSISDGLLAAVDKARSL